MRAHDTGSVPLQLSFRHIDPTDAIKDYAYQKVSKLEGLLRDERPLHMVVGKDGDLQFAEVELLDGHRRFFARADEGDLYTSIDSAIDKLARQLDDDHKKSRDVRRSEQAKAKRDASATSE